MHGRLLAQGLLLPMIPICTNLNLNSSIIELVAAEESRRCLISHPNDVSSSIMTAKPIIRPTVAERCEPWRWVSGIISWLIT